MGCGDSRSYLSLEEQSIIAAEEKIVDETVTPEQVTRVICKYSKDKVITDSQLVRILAKLGKKGRDPALAKQVYFGESYFHAEPSGYDKYRVAALFLLLCPGSTSQKTQELSLLSHQASFSPADLHNFLHTLISISVIYCPLLVSPPFASLQTYISSLHLYAETLIGKITQEISGNEASLTTEGLIFRLNSSGYSGIWTTRGVRRLIIESGVGVKQAKVKGKAVVMRRGSKIREYIAN